MLHLFLKTNCKTCQGPAFDAETDIATSHNISSKGKTCKVGNSFFALDMILKTQEMDGVYVERLFLWNT